MGRREREVNDWWVGEREVCDRWVGEREGCGGGVLERERGVWGVGERERGMREGCEVCRLATSDLRSRTVVLVGGKRTLPVVAA